MLPEPQCVDDAPRFFPDCRWRGDRAENHRWLGSVPGGVAGFAAHDGGIIALGSEYGFLYESNGVAPIERRPGQAPPSGVTGIALDVASNGRVLALVQDSEDETVSLRVHDGDASSTVPLSPMGPSLDVPSARIFTLDATGATVLLVAQDENNVYVWPFTLTGTGADVSAALVILSDDSIAVGASEFSAARRPSPGGEGVPAVVVTDVGVLALTRDAGGDLQAATTIFSKPLAPPFATTLTPDTVWIIDNPADGARLRGASVSELDASTPIDFSLEPAFEGLAAPDSADAPVLAGDTDSCVSVGAARGFLAFASGDAARTLGGLRAPSVKAIDVVSSGGVWIWYEHGYVAFLETPPCASEAGSQNAFGSSASGSLLLLDANKGGGPIGAMHTVLADDSWLLGGLGAIFHVDATPSDPAQAVFQAALPSEDLVPLVAVAAAELDEPATDNILLTMSDGSLARWGRAVVSVSAVDTVRLPVGEINDPGTVAHEHGIVASMVKGAPQEEGGAPNVVDIWAAGLADDGTRDLAIVRCTATLSELDVALTCGDELRLGRRVPDDATFETFRLHDLEVRAPCGEGSAMLLATDELWFINIEGNEPVGAHAAGDDFGSAIGDKVTEIIVLDDVLDEIDPPSVAVGGAWRGDLHVFSLTENGVQARAPLDQFTYGIFQAAPRGGDLWLGVAARKFFSLRASVLRQGGNGYQLIGPDHSVFSIEAIAMSPGKTYVADSNSDVYALEAE